MLEFIAFYSVRPKQAASLQLVKDGKFNMFELEDDYKKLKKLDKEGKFLEDAWELAYTAAFK
jgi:hypothetical protein